MKLSLVASLLALNVIGAAQAATCFVNFYWGSTSYVSQDHVFGEIRAGTNCNPRVGLVSLKTQDYCDPHDASECYPFDVAALSLYRSIEHRLSVLIHHRALRQMGRSSQDRH